MYQVSVRTVREALALLEQSGYLQCQSRRRAVILSGPTPQTAQLIEETLRQRDQFSDGYRTIRRLLPGRQPRFTLPPGKQPFPLF